MNQSSSILLIEDDLAQRLSLAAYLRQANLGVSEADSLSQGRSLIDIKQPRLILLDLNLPKGEGLAFAQEILNRQIPLIMVSNRPQDKILALELGVDDYLDKPYQPRELLARIQNLLRRYQSLLPEAFHFGLFCLDPSGRRLMNAEGKEVGITRGEFDLLAALLKAKGRVLSRAQLSEIISPDGAVVSNRSVDTLVFRLRRKLADDPRCPTLLQTIPGVGYRMVV